MTKWLMRHGFSRNGSDAILGLFCFTLFVLASIVFLEDFKDTGTYAYEFIPGITIAE